MWLTTIALSQFQVIKVCSLSVLLPIPRFPSRLKVALIPCAQCGIMTVWQLSKTRDLFVHIKTEGTWWVNIKATVGFIHFHTYWCVRARRLSRLVYPAAARVSLYLSSPMDCSHAHTDHSGTHTSGTTDTHTSDPTPASRMAPVGLWKQRQWEQTGGKVLK